MKKLFLSAALALATAVSAFAATASSASAATKAGASTTASVQVVTAPMTLDCGTMSAKAHQYAVAHGYCAGGSRSPDTVVTGNCGSSEIYIYTDYSTPDLGWADIKYGFASTKGTVIYRNLGVGYAGESDSGGFNDSSVMFSSSYTRTVSRYVGSGEAYASVGGTVTLWWGAQCTLLEPEASGDIV